MRVRVSHSVAIHGVEGAVIRVEVATLGGIPSLAIVGLADTAVSESRERLRAGFAACDIPFPRSRITVNLSPADLPKAGTGFDLPIAVAILAAAHEKTLDRRTVYLGELGLDGGVRAVRGTLPAVLAAKRAGFERVVVPAECGEEARLAGIEVVELWHLSQVAAELGIDSCPVPPRPRVTQQAGRARRVGDMREVLGQREAIRAVEIAAAGSHHLLMTGAPGIGKTMIAERIPGILPPLDEAAAVEVAAIQSVLGEFSGRLDPTPPFTAPHHSASAVALVGGGGKPRPGAVSRAHRGVLFLDEIPEFSGTALQALRQPMETGQVHLARASGAVTFPARFQLIAAANPCKCGNYLDDPARCSCSVQQRRNYWRRLGGPILDRFDLNIVLRRPTRAELSGRSPNEASETIAARVRVAKEKQRHRYAGLAWESNAHAPGKWIRENVKMPNLISRRFSDLLSRGELSMRAVDKILRVALSIADLGSGGPPDSGDFAEAFTLRMRGAGNV